MSYPEIEEALRQRLVQRMDTALSDARCVKSNIDRLFTAMQQEQANYGCLLDFGGGQKLEAAPYNGRMWQWTVNCALLLRYTGDNEQIEADARDFLQRIYITLDGDHTLSGTCAVAFITTIAPPQPGTVNDVPFYWLLFEVAALERI